MNVPATVDAVLYPLRCYPDKTRLRNDAIGLLNCYRDLHPNVSPAPTGPQPLFNVMGTIPVNIRGTRYNIPVRMWIPVEYPYRPPMVYVTPTPGMSITPNHPQVNASGVVFLPYMQTWNPATHSLLPLVQAMTTVFSQKTPLYSGPPPQAAPPSYPGYGQQPPNAYPPRPAAGGYQPPYPGQQAQPQPARFSPYSSQPPQQPQQPSPYPPQQPQQGYPPQQPPHQPGPYPSQPGPYPSQQPPQQPSQPKHRPVPRTPMDEKRDRLRDMCRAKIRDLTKEDLDVKSQRLQQEKREKENMLNNAMSQQEQMKKEIADLDQRIKDLDDFLAKNTGELDIDKITDPRDVHRLQLIHAVSLDMAIEDILYHFDRALLKGVISLDEYLKLCRQYSNDQFYQRALTKRIREVISAPPPR